MASLQPTAPSAQPPPDLPNDPALSTQISQYLRTFALWCRNGFAAKLDANTALPGLLLQANDAAPGTNPPVFMLQVDSAGNLVAVPTPIGGQR